MTQEVIAAYEALLERALNVLNGAPYWSPAVYNYEFATLSIDGDDAIVTWPEAEAAGDDCVIQASRTRFPSRLLTMPDDELATWKTEETRRYEEGRKAEEVAAARAAEEEGRRLLAKLQAR